MQAFIRDKTAHGAAAYIVPVKQTLTAIGRVG